MSDLVTNRTWAELIVKNSIITILDISEEKFTEDTTLLDLGSDSLERIEIYLAIEDRSNHVISSEELEDEVTHKTTVGELIDLVVKKKELYG